MRIKKERKVVCIDCKQEFVAFSEKALRCPECKETHLRNYKAANQAKYRSLNYARTKARKKSPHLSIGEVLRQMVRYNEENNQNLSYGKFVQILERGEA